ncbi:MAG: SIMPL domain-containing protein [Anaerolineae bacterium]|nr:SIMPL domain-containing protein [Anaerolineae bacterium]
MGNRKWFKLVVGIAVVGALAVVAGCASAVDAGGGSRAALAGGGDAATAYTINVNGTGIASGAPDVADIVLGVDVVNVDAGKAVTESSATMNAVLDAVKALGIEEKDIQTANYSMWVEQVYDKEGQPTGERRYHVSHQLRIRLRDVAATGRVLEAALDAGANTVNGVTFTVEDSKALQQVARQEAVQNARAKAEQLAAGLGVKLGDIRQVSEYSGYQPAPVPVMMAGRGGDEDLAISSGSFNVTVEVQITFDIVQ